MASLDLKNGTYLIRFRHDGRSYKRSLKTESKSDAQAALNLVKLTLHRFMVGLLQVPPDIDPGDFIVSGGTATAPKSTEPAPTLVAASREYLDRLLHLAESTRITVRVQLNNFVRKLATKAEKPIDHLRPKDLDAYLQARLAERGKNTVSKERATIITFFEWVVMQGYVTASPALNLVRVKGGGDPQRFQTLAEINATIARGGLAPAEEWALWDCLYLAPTEIAALLALVKQRAKHEVSYVLHAIPAYTGMRRGEILRLRWADLELEQGGIWARSLKQSRQSAETKRRIDLHPELKVILTAWRDRHPLGQFVACDEGVLDPLGRHQAEERFWQPLRGTDWCIPARNDRPKVGFHAYRHSFASNLAAAGVDQRVIDEFMGHTTEAMRKRYRHLFPSNKKSAIESFSLAVG